MLVDQGLRWISKQQLRDDQEANVLLAIEGLLQNVAAVTVRGELHNAAPVAPCQTEPDSGMWMTYCMQATILRRSSTVDVASRHLCTAQLPNLQE